MLRDSSAKAGRFSARMCIITIDSAMRTAALQKCPLQTELGRGNSPIHNRANFPSLWAVSNPKAPQKVPSGLPGLDTLLGGGFPPGKVVLVLGEPGTGKSI